MFNEFFSKKKVNENDREAVKVIAKGNYSLDDTFLCGQFFKYEEICREDGYTEYFIPVGNRLIFVGQKSQASLPWPLKTISSELPPRRHAEYGYLSRNPGKRYARLLYLRTTIFPALEKL